MKPFEVKPNKNFIGREYELKKLQEIGELNEASIIVVYGRRRVGKTELIERSFHNRNLIKFEGIEGVSAKEQIQNVLRQLSEYVEDPLIAKLSLDSWTKVFQLLAKYVSKGKWTVFLDEIQWMASYEGKLLAELKYMWDNYFKKNDSLILVLCGSSPSFIINKILHSKALYNRSQYEISLQELGLQEIKLFLKASRSKKEIMDACLTIGGIPEYLKYVNRESSVFLGLCKNSFINGGFFTNEFERIFTSSLGSDRSYSKIIGFLSNRKFASRSEIAAHLRSQSGGTLTEVLENLELCGFITRYSPFNLGERSALTRYAISDQYLQFYFKFIAPFQNDIKNGRFNSDPTAPIKMDTYNKWLGFGFERFCRKHHHIFANLLSFGGVVYQSGAFFSRQSAASKKGLQIDLVFDRADKVYTMCEIKYTQTAASIRVAEEFENKKQIFPNSKKYTIHKVLITAAGADKKLMDSHYFDKILTLDDIIV